MALFTDLYLRAVAKFRREDGQGLAEYALILALIAIVAIVALIFLGGAGQQDPEHGRRVGLGGPPTNDDRRA